MSDRRCPVVDAVREDLQQRSQLGIAKYGHTLAENPLTLRQWLQHAYEECLDQANYLKRSIMELAGQVAATEPERGSDAGAAEYASWDMRIPLRTQYERHLERGLEGYRQELQDVSKDRDRLMIELGTARKYQQRDVWFWQGDGEDHPESMGNSMVVVIRAADLRAAIAEGGRTYGGHQQ